MSMSDSTANTAGEGASVAGVGPPGRTRWQRVRHLVRVQPIGAISLLIIVGLVLVAIFAPWLAPYDATAGVGPTLEAPSSSHWFGTDNQGRDIFSRVIEGSRTALQVAIFATALGVVMGSFIGLVSGYFGGWLDMIVQRFVDAVMAFPLLILALVMIAVVGESLRNVIIVIGIGITPGITRIVRGLVLSERENQYIEAARTIGASAPRILWRHLLPNLVAPIVVVGSAVMPGVVLVEAGLSFLGLGTPPPTPSWGRDLSDQRFFRTGPWMAIFPGLALSLLVLAFNLLGDAIRDVVDPRLRNR